jgi:hypothetical protein
VSRREDKPSPFARSALTYAERWGLFVLPLIVGSKEPHGWSVPHGHLDASADLGIIEHWWSRAPRANVGIACAKSDLLVIDVDPRNAGDETLGALLKRLGDLPPTWTTLTPGGGQHYYFRHEGELAVGSLGEGIDLKWNGYVVAPPSIHPNGGRYRWDVGFHPTNTPLAELPDVWLARILGRPRICARPPTTGLDAQQSFLGAAFAMLGWLGPMLDGGRRMARCPWAAEHSDGRGKGRDSSTVLFSPLVGTLIGGFHCSHGHCEGRGLLDVLRILPLEAIDLAARAYPQAYRSLVRQLAKDRPAEPLNKGAGHAQ